MLGAVFLASYAYSSLAPGPYGMAVFLGTGAVLYALSVPWTSTFHKVLASVAFAAFGVLLLSGRFEAGEFFEGLPIYFNIIAVLIILSIAGYPLRAERFEVQIRALMHAMRERGVGVRTTAGALGHVLGAVLDVGSFVLTDVVLRRAVPKEHVEALTWAARGFSFSPLWTNLNVFTVTTIMLTGVSYPGLLATILPFVIPGLAVTLLFAQREKGEESESSETLNRGAIAVLLYPMLLVAAVALVTVLLPELELTIVIAATVAVAVVLIAATATMLLRQTSPARRLASETRDSLVGSHAEFALFGSAGVLVLSLQGLGALAPVGSLLSALPSVLVAPALALVMGLGWVVGIHVIPLALLIDTAFPLSEGPAPALWAAAILLGAQGAILLTPFSNATTMLARLTGLHPLEIGPKRNWKFSLFVALAGLLYLGLLTLLLL
ncbi:MAG: hypothetical protein M3N18_09675 [Actinomycetota bacterium]|nr:hypothetical protein [Actinomycetota bacterium]